MKLNRTENERDLSVVSGGSALLPLLGRGAPGADERHDDDHNHSDGAHGHDDDDQEVTVLLRRDATVRRSHLTNGRL